MNAAQFDKWVPLITGAVSNFVRDNSAKFDFWRKLRTQKGKYGGYNQFKNEKWFQSELALFLSQTIPPAIAGSAWEIIPETRRKDIDYDLFVVTEPNLVPGVGDISRIWPYGFGIHLKSWWNSFYGESELDVLLEDVIKASRNKGVPCIGINLVKKVVAVAWEKAIVAHRDIYTVVSEEIQKDEYLLIWTYKG